MSDIGYFESMLDLYPPENMTDVKDNTTLKYAKKGNHRLTSSFTHFKKKKKCRHITEDCCTDRTGKFKNSYKSKSEAQHMADHIFSLRGEKLAVYECRNSKGWHLTNPNH